MGLLTLAAFAEFCWSVMKRVSPPGRRIGVELAKLYPVCDPPVIQKSNFMIIFISLDYMVAGKLGQIRNFIAAVVVVEAGDVWQAARSANLSNR